MLVSYTKSPRDGVTITAQFICEPFPACCGAGILHSFGIQKREIVNKQTRLDDLTPEEKQDIETWFKTWFFGQTLNYIGITVKEYVEPGMGNLGWFYGMMERTGTVLGSAHNPNSGNTLNFVLFNKQEKGFDDDYGDDEL